jgi:YVTN family beta-propeller protein
MAAFTVVAVPSGPAAAVPPGSYALVANYGSDTVSLVDTATDTVTATVAAGSGPREVAVTPDGTNACVTNSGGGMSVIELRQGTRIFRCHHALAPGADASGARDAKVDDIAAAVAGVGPRVLLLITEAYRHGKALGAWADGADALETAGIAPDAPGVLTATDPAAALDGLTQLPAHHRAWDRFTPATDLRPHGPRRVARAGSWGRPVSEGVADAEHGARACGNQFTEPVHRFVFHRAAPEAGLVVRVPCPDP